MILVDSTIWIDHFNRGDAALAELLARDEVLMHPYVIGEVALGSLRRRDLVLGALRRIPELLPVRPSEVLSLIQQAALGGLGIGYVDAHLLASVRMRPGTRLWTREKRLDAIAARMGLVHRP